MLFSRRTSAPKRSALFQSKSIKGNIHACNPIELKIKIVGSDATMAASFHSSFDCEDSVFHLLKCLRAAAAARNTVAVLISPSAVTSRWWMPPELAATMPVDRRSLFIKIIDEFPIAEVDIADYFTRKWGDWVERVVAKPPAVASLVADS